MSDLIFAYITCKNSTQAEEIGFALVEERLAACANIYPATTSIYRWKGKVEKAEESLLLVKTRASLFEKLEKKVKAMHSYDVPCILSFAVEDGSEEFLNWMKAETSN